MQNKMTLSLLLAAVVTMMTSTTTVYGSTGMSNCTEEPDNDDCNPQPDRVGNDHDEDDEVTRDGPDDEGEENCWGKVTSDGARTLDPGDFGAHASNPTGDEDNDTPREGVGNQNEDHPSDHADQVGGAFSDEDCIDPGNPDGD
jgi:hypothetical protein